MKDGTLNSNCKRKTKKEASSSRLVCTAKAEYWCLAIWSSLLMFEAQCLSDIETNGRIAEAINECVNEWMLSRRKPAMIRTGNKFGSDGSSLAAYTAWTGNSARCALSFLVLLDLTRVLGSHTSGSPLHGQVQKTCRYLFGSAVSTF